MGHQQDFVIVVKAPSVQMMFQELNKWTREYEGAPQDTRWADRGENKSCDLQVELTKQNLSSIVMLTKGCANTKALA